MKRLQRILVFVVSLGLINTSMIQAVHAGMVTTEDAARLSGTAPERAGTGHARLASVLARADVRSEMERMGVSPTAAAERVAALTDAEATKLADKIESAPAGAGVLGWIVFIFLLLLVTDILGFTKIFPFTRSIR